MNRLGFKVTVVEIGRSLKRGGSPVDIRDGTVDIVRRMGLYEGIRACSLKAKRTFFKNMDDVTVAEILPEPTEGHSSANEYEVERDTLLDIMFAAIVNDVEFIFGDSITALDQGETDVSVSFMSGTHDFFDLVLGCDGNHSSLREMVFGPEVDFAVFLQNYFAISIVEGLLIEEDTTQIYNAPGKAVMLNAYNNKTDIAFCFFSRNEIAYDYRDLEKQRRIICDQFATEGWRTREVLELATRCENFYFDKFAQIKMPFWSKGRVALVGDAAYCATPAAGMGGSLAIVGATALADAFLKHGGNVELALREYDSSLRPLVEKVQCGAVDFGLEMFAPKTQEAIQARNERYAVAQAKW